MASNPIKLSELTAAAQANGDDIVHVSVPDGQGGYVTKSLTTQQIADLASGWEIGDIGIFPESKTMPGWLDLDGSAYNYSEYTNLFDLYQDWVSRPLDDAHPTDGILYDYIRAIASDDSYIFIGVPYQPGLLVISKTDFSVIDGTPDIGDSVNSLSTDLSNIYVGHIGGLTVIRKSDFSIDTGYPPAPDSIDAVSDDDLYLYTGFSTYSGNGFQVIEKSTKSVVSGTPVLNDTPAGISNDNSYVYIIHPDYNSSGFTVIDKSDWSVVSGTPSVSMGSGVANDDSYVYLTNREYEGVGLIVVDKTDWSVVPGTPNIVSDAKDVSVDDFYVYVARSDGGSDKEGLTIIDKADWSVVDDRFRLKNDGLVSYNDASYLYIGAGGEPYLIAIIKTGSQDTYRTPYTDPAAKGTVYRVKAE